MIGFEPTKLGPKRKVKKKDSSVISRTPYRGKFRWQRY